MMFFGRAVKIRCALGLLVAFGDLIEFLLPGWPQSALIPHYAGRALWGSAFFRGLFKNENCLKSVFFEERENFKKKTIYSTGNFIQ